MTVFEHLRTPSLGGGAEWLNSEPLGPAELRGHVVVVDFWTLTCLNRFPKSRTSVIMASRGSWVMNRTGPVNWSRWLRSRARWACPPEIWCGRLAARTVRSSRSKRCQQSRYAEWPRDRAAGLNRAGTLPRPLGRRALAGRLSGPEVARWMSRRLGSWRQVWPGPAQGLANPAAVRTPAPSADRT
jgi:hypothetical protein